MNDTKSKIEIRAEEEEISVMLNGKEMSGVIVGLSLEITPHSQPVVTMSVIPDELIVALDDTEINLSTENL